MCGAATSLCPSADCWSCVRAWAVTRLCEEQGLLAQLPRLPDLQGAWLLLALCAAPRANHALRTIPPPDVAPYARMHDDAVWNTLATLLGGVPPQEAAQARAVAELPAALGGLGLLSATRTAPAAYWAGWADALPVLRQRLPEFAETCVRLLAKGGGGAPSLQRAAEARTLLQTEGWHTCPAWRDIVEGTRPPPMRDTGLGDWPHGWQSHASRTRTLYVRVFLPTLSPAACALVRSQSGPHAGAWLTAVPADPACTLQPQAMQVAADASASRCPFARTAAGPTQGAEGEPTRWVITRSPALGPGCLPAEPRC